jgi:hypothetical protein
MRRRERPPVQSVGAVNYINAKRQKPRRGKPGFHSRTTGWRDTRLDRPILQTAQPSVRFRNIGGRSRPATAVQEPPNITCVAVSGIGGFSVASSAMNDVEPPTGAYYRAKAGEIRLAARSSRSPEVRRELLELAYRFDRMADYADSRTPCTATAASVSSVSGDRDEAAPGIAFPTPPPQQLLGEGS